MPPARPHLGRPGLDASTGKFWCDCTVQGCRTEIRHLNKVDRRTYYAHQKQQRGATLRAQNATAFDLQSVRASQGTNAPALSADFGGSSGTSGIENDDNSYLPDIEDALGLTPFHSTISSSGSSSNASDDEEVEVDSEFGDGLEREEMMDSERPVFDCGEDEMAEEGIEEAIQEWRGRDPDAGMGDVYDGTAWSSERDRNDKRFVDHSHSFLVALGIDWFSPFSSQYTSWHSTGAIMMTLLNLPERLRYHPSTTYLAGCTPGPKEPSAARLPCYLRPLLTELLDLDEGVRIPTLRKPNGQLVRLRVAMFCGDSVSRNKVCGFPPHSVRVGKFCGLCDVTIPTITAFERSTGARASPLNRLSYWQSVDRAPVDHMHNLELGVVKRLFHRTLIEGKSISPLQLKRLQSCLSTALVPPSEQAPDARLGDPGEGSATAAHWSTLGRRLLVLLLFVAWQPLVEADDSLVFEPPLSKTAAAAVAAATVAAARLEDDVETGVDEEPTVVESGTASTEDDQPMSLVEAAANGPAVSSARRTAAAAAATRAAAAARRAAASADVQAAVATTSAAAATRAAAAAQAAAGTRAAASASATTPAAAAVTLATAAAAATTPATEAAATPADVKAKRIQARDALRNAALLAGAATLAARRRISSQEIDDLDSLLREFGRTTATLYGEKWVVYNSHMMTHLPAHVRRFGPAYHFSSYHFERMNGQLGNVNTNRHRNGEIEATYTRAFLTTARSGLLLASSKDDINAALQARAPVFVPPAPVFLSPVSVLGASGVVAVELSDGRPFELARELHGQLFEHVRRTWSDQFPPLLPPTSSQRTGLRVLPFFQQHRTMRFGHLSFSSIGSRANANRTRTYAAVEGSGGSLDLFRIEVILSHTIHVKSRVHTAVYLLGHRGQREVVPAFDRVLGEELL
ncbi:unnamed protein product, partial [Tilletia controversa]